MGYRVLVVDDSPVARALLDEMLGTLGHQVVAEADSVATVFGAYQEHHPDLVTLDVSLPDGDGLSVLRELRATDPTARVILVTGNDQQELVERAVRLRAAGVLLKPFTKAELADRIAQAFGGQEGRAS